MAFTFDGYVLDIPLRELRRGTARIKVEPQVFDLLAYLVTRRDRVISKDELIEAVWHGRIVSDSALTTRINGARQAIGDNGAEQRQIRTIRRRGFRFVGDVRELPARQDALQAERPSATGPSLAAPQFAHRASVAVLQFTSISRDPETQCIADGLAEDVVTALSRFRWLFVLAPILQPASRFGELDWKRTIYDLSVRYVLQGAVRCSGQNIRVNAHLIDAINGARLWTETFDGMLGEGFELQDKVASIIAGSIEPILKLAEARRFSSVPRRDATPYELHLQAHPIFSRGRENVLRSLSLLERATELDPNYGPALADAANCRQILDVNGWAVNRDLNRQRAIALAQDALRLLSDPAAVAISAFVLAYFGQDIDAAFTLLDNALQLTPSFAKGWYMNGMTCLYAGRLEQAIECFETSIRLSPRDHAAGRSTAGIGIAHFFNRNFDLAIPILRPVVHQFPHWVTPYCALASCHSHLGFLDESEAIARRARTTDASLNPSSNQFRDPEHRELLSPGLKLIGNFSPSA